MGQETGETEGTVAKPFRVVLLIDMNAFFASVELNENPSLVGKPVVIGRLRKRKVVSTATPQARALGIEKGMPMMEAKKYFTPETVVIEPRVYLYEAESDCLDPVH